METDGGEGVAEWQAWLDHHNVFTGANLGTGLADFHMEIGQSSNALCRWAVRSAKSHSESARVQLIQVF